MPPFHTSTFGPLTVRWDDRVLEPRPWTLLQSEWAIELAETLPDGAILELCAGAGHIGLAAALTIGRRLVQVERDPVAAGYAHGNADTAGLATSVEVRARALEHALRPEERFALILADPPYLPSDQVRRWPDDPPTAIDGGADGLDVVRSCLAVAAGHLLPGGSVLLQVAGRAQAVQADHLDPRLALVDVREHDAQRAVALLRPVS